MAEQFLDRIGLRLAMDALEAFRVVVVNGPRQAGKSTLLELIERQRGGTRLTLDDRDVLRAARTDPSGLLSAAGHPVMIDEAQRGGDPLILAIKADVDRHGFDNGRYVLAGSSRFLTIPTLSESLAGRVRIIDLWPLSQSERQGTTPGFVDDLFGPTSVLRETSANSVSRRELLERITVGGFPAVTRIGRARDRTDWFADYLRTLLERDLAELRSPRRVVDLPRLLRLIGQRTATELVIAPISSDLGIAADTVKDYLGLFESIYLHHTIPAWTPGGAGRVVHRPKLHVVDSGVACYLLGVGERELARPGNTPVGHIIESFVVGELQRQIPSSDLRPTIHHYRDKLHREIDVILETRDGRVAAIEVKAAVDVGDDDFRHLRWLRDQLGDRFANGIVLHAGDRSFAAGDRLTSMPISALWSDPR